MPKPFLNPYESWRKLAKPVVKFNCDVGMDDYNHIRSIRPGKGTVSTTVNIMYKALVEELRKRNLTTFADVQEFQFCIANIQIVLPTKQEYEDYVKRTRTSNDAGTVSNLADVQRSPIGGAGGQANAPDDGARKAGKSAAHTEVKTEQSDLGSGSKKKRANNAATGQPS